MLLREHSAALEADFHEHYGVDLQSCSVRKAAALAFHLPPGSRVAQQYDPAQEWTVTDYLLAGVFDALQNLTWVTATVNSKKPPPKPKPLPRPGDRTAVRNQPKVSGLALGAFIEGG